MQAIVHIIKKNKENEKNGKCNAGFDAIFRQKCD